jgi:hypothetical protein
MLFEERIVSREAWAEGLRNSLESLARIDSRVAANAQAWFESMTTPEQRAQYAAELAQRAAWHESPGYHWLGVYAEEDHKLWPNSDNC